VSVVRVEEVSRHYGEREARVVALDRVSVDIERGEYTAIMEPSGSGKTTLLSILGSMNPPTSRQLPVDDLGVYALSCDDRPGICAVPEDLALATGGLTR